MPKGTMNLQEQIEQHVEKGVLGLVVLGLLYALSHWVFSSPRTVEISPGGTTQTVAPGEVDDVIIAQAMKVDKEVDSQEFPPQELTSSKYELDYLQTTPFLTDLSAMRWLTIGPVPSVDGPGPEGDPCSVDEIRQRSNLSQAPAAPVVEASWVWFQDGNETGKSILANGLMSYPLETLKSQMEEILEARTPSEFRVHVAGVEIQAQRRDGVRWVDVEAGLASSGPADIPQAPAVTPEMVDKDAVKAWVEQVSADEVKIITPGFFDVYSPDSGSYIAWRDMLSADAIEAANVWFHAVSLRPGSEYRYRYRLVVVNPLFGWFESVPEDQLENASIPFIEGEWSGWSDPVAVLGLTEFYLSGSNSNTNSVKVSVVTQVFGQAIMTDFNVVSPGEPIGAEKNVEIQLAGGTQTEVETVDFSTGAIIVDINFEKQTYSRGIERTDTEMIYIDDSGELQSRIRWMDQDRLR